ncbi:CD3e molecule, epsilon associated protein [Notolabrus celidotus]|uniref:CD3e molecule, epsilon associated protein n=1 Tax=Notolabrus celidotus TaxID=1203425 RepID=UPI00148FA8B8|nr:CD3e molecule, epsilon associated protein [Notolabrus celidotus]
MPRDVSSSSSEEEEDSPPTKSHQKQKQSNKKPTRYQCPADFVSFSHKPCSSTLTESLKNNNNELWLIKAPSNFKPECFSGINLPLSGLRTVKVPTAAGGGQTGGSKQIFSILASPHGTSELCLLTGDKLQSDSHTFGPAFSGLLNVCESYGGSSANQTPHVIPATPAPSIPPGLKQRFLPFGSKTPTRSCVAKTEVDAGATFGSSSKTFRPWLVKRSAEETLQEEEEEEDEGRKKKKKKKKDKKEKRVKTEVLDNYLEMGILKEEPVFETQEEVMMELPVEEKRKKKKKKKDREREEVEESVEPSVRVKQEVVTVKTEPIDILYGDLEEGSGKKKKKKKKKNRSDDD